MKIPQVEPFVRRSFEWYGFIVYTWRWYLLITPILLTCVCSLGFFKMRELQVDDPSYVFTPSDARWRKELKVFNDNWPLNENKFLPGKSFLTKRFINILIRSKDGGSILESNVLQEIQILNNWIMYNISIPTENALYNLTYQDLCLSYDWVCGANEHIQMLSRRDDVNEFLNLHFPRGGTKDNPLYFGNIFGDPQLSENGTVSSAKLTQLFYFLKQDQKMVEEYSSKFSYAVEQFLEHVFKSNVITVSFAHYQSLEDGLDENAKEFVPNFVVSFVVLASYAIFSSFTFQHGATGKIDWICSKPWLACAGMFTTVISLISAFGTLFLLGIHYNVINTIIPFLIIAIGIDDMFLMNACWDQTCKTFPVPERVSKTLSHAGVAVTITNITDIMSFAIGCITNLPGIQYFCVYACVSVAFSYLYQLTFFCGAIAIMGNVEKNKRHCLFLHRCDVSLSSTAVKEVNGTTKIPKTDSKIMLLHRNYLSRFLFANDNNVNSEKQNDKIISANLNFQNVKEKIEDENNNEKNRKPKKDKVTQFFGETYGPFILSNTVRCIAGIIFCFYMAIAIIGCCSFREGLNPENLVTNDHYIAHYFADIKHFWKVGPQLHVAILNPPDFTNSTERKKVFDIVEAFENTPYTLGREGTMFFLIEYLNYLEDLNVEIDDSSKLWKTKLLSWLKYTGGSTQWDSCIRMDPKKEMFLSIRFQIALKNFVEPNDHKSAAQLLRSIADHQPYDVVVYHEAFPFADQYLIILPATIQNVLISLFCMAVVSTLLVPSLPSGLVIFVAIISINIGVFGYMTLWGVNLDAVSMISIIMSIGFAVDLSAHIIYAFVTSEGDTKQRVIGALETLGWPIFQGASSTIAGISILYTVNAYIILTFFKTIWLTMFIGAIHGLFFIPIFLSLFPVAFYRIPENSALH